MRKALLCYAVLVIAYSNTLGQIKWDIEDESINLNPTKINLQALLYLKRDSRNTIEIKPDNGIVTVDLSDKAFFILNNGNFYKFKPEQVEILSLVKKERNEIIRIYKSEDLFAKNFSDSLLIMHRKSIFDSLNLNPISFAYAKKNTFDIDANGLITQKNQKIFKGKICSVGLTHILILNEDGELSLFKDGDFNFLTVANFKAFKCQDLYQFIYKDFQEKLNLYIKSWESKLASLEIDSLMSILGAFNEATTIPDKRIMYVWKNDNIFYEFNSSTSTQSIGTQFRLSNSFFNPFSGVYNHGYSPFFIYGNSYRQTNFNSTSITNNTSQTNQYGQIIQHDNGYRIVLIKDTNGKNTRVLHENVFSKSNYGEPFKFINF